MCRFVAYLGEPVPLDAIVCRPRHSLLRQARHARRAPSAIHGDGFGVGWYDDGGTPSVRRAAVPAWSGDGLRTLCERIRAGLFFAHVRAATGTEVARRNSHPFRLGRHLFMHNGQIGGYPSVRAALEARLPASLQAAREGGTDSELIFLLAMARAADGLAPAHAVMRALDDAHEAMVVEGVSQPLTFAAALSDGRDLWAFRVASHGAPPSLYVRRSATGVVVASEPFDDDSEDWAPVAPGTAVRIGPRAARVAVRGDTGRVLEMA